MTRRPGAGSGRRVGAMIWSWRPPFRRAGLWSGAHLIGFWSGGAWSSVSR